MDPKRITVLLLLLLGLTACKSDESAANGSKVDQPAAIELGFDDGDMQAAADKLSEKLDRQDAVGWPDSVTLGSGGRPFIRIGRVQNRTREMIDMERFKGTLEAALGTQVTADAEQDLELVLTGSVSATVSLGEEESEHDYTVHLKIIDPRDGGIVVSSLSRTLKTQSRQAFGN